MLDYDRGLWAERVKTALIGLAVVAFIVGLVLLFWNALEECSERCAKMGKHGFWSRDSGCICADRPPQ